MILQGDCKQVLEDYPPHSFDALVTDPPAGIAFMNKHWDKDKGGRDAWVNWMTSVMTECKRVLKPGAHAFVWAIPRTSHWTATALEDAGFEIRDVVTHLFGSGFPKSLNVGKALPEWEGWGTALKPASEHWILCRVPLEKKTVAENVKAYGTGGINIDGSRVKTTEVKKQTPYEYVGDNGNSMGKASKRLRTSGSGTENPQGRFPSNFICSGEARDMLDEQSGVTKPVLRKDHSSIGGGASRFFYCAKASKSERNAGCEGLEEKTQGTYGKFAGDGRGRQVEHQPTTNHHPTVKPQKLMTYLINMITPPGGHVLDPFAGSGSTGVAAVKAGFQFTGIEAEAEYVEIARNRLEYAKTEAEGQTSFAL